MSKLDDRIIDRLNSKNIILNKKIIKLESEIKTIKELACSCNHYLDCPVLELLQKIDEVK